MPLPPPQAVGNQDYIPEQVGRSVYDSLKILGLRLGALEREINLAYRRLTYLYHPDKWDQVQATTGMTLQETTEHFQLLNNAHSFLWANL
jgi:DnaJ-class molecular chaperone